MQELTLNEVLTQAFLRAQDMDAPLAGKLQSFADSVRLASAAFADAADRLVFRLEQSGSGASAPKIGEPMPYFVLPDERGRLVALDQLLERGPVAISFHRGHWCPYCRINTNALSRAQCEVEPLGAQIVGITPDLRRFTVTMQENGTSGYFPILTDVDNGYAMSLNLTIFVGQEMKTFMKEGGWDIAPYQGNDAWLLPIPATFVVGRDGRIVSRHIDPDYRRRMAIEDIVAALKAA